MKNLQQLRHDIREHLDRPRDVAQWLDALSRAVNGAHDEAAALGQDTGRWAQVAAIVQRAMIEAEEATR